MPDEDRRRNSNRPGTRTRRKTERLHSQLSSSTFQAKGDMEVSMELEDDVFFADLSKQISLLIMDDDEEDPTTRRPLVSLQASSHVYHPSVHSPLLYEPTYGRESKGTGVFIPKSSLLRRKNRQGRYTSFNSKSCKKPDKSKGASHVTYRNDPSCNSLNSKKR